MSIEDSGLAFKSAALTASVCLCQVSHWVGHPNFELVRHDVVEPFMIEVDQVYHLACPASPPHYQYNAVKTIKTSFQGTLNMLGLAKRVKARFLISSTSGAFLDPTWRAVDPSDTVTDRPAVCS